MEIAVVNPQTVLQMYHCKDYPWQSMATSPVTDKEMIIANADFTMTSAIARRRLSSKKRKADNSGGNSCDGSATNSPTGSLDSLTRHPSPAVSIQTPPVTESGSVVYRPLSDLPSTTHLTHHLSSRHSSHTDTHQVVPSHPHASAGAQEPFAPSIVPAAYHFAPSLPVTTAGTEQEAFAHHPMYSHLQRELSYRYLQDQSGSGSVQHGNRSTAAFSAPNSQAGRQPHQGCESLTAQSAVGVTGEGKRPHRHVKWCSAHITIARQIQAHQRQAKTVLDLAQSAGVINTESVAGVKSNIPTTTVDPVQQMALLQMYGVPTTGVPSYVTVPGVPYSTIPDLQLRNLSFVPHTAPTALFMDAANMLSVKPITGITTQASENSNLNVQMMNGVQLLPYTQSMPVAAVMPGGGANSGSYIGPVPVPVIGNCVLNPCQPGVTAAPWVR